MSNDVIYDENWASVYEKFAGVRGRIDEANETAAFLQEYAAGGSALELGIGNGRVAVPLSQRGVGVEGIDNSNSMLKLLAERSDLVKAWEGDIGNFTSEQSYSLVYCVYNTFTLLFTRESQVNCLRSASMVLDKTGFLVIELGVPALDGFCSGQKITTLAVDEENTILNSDLHDPLKQNFVSTLLWFSGASVKRLPHRVRYVYHQELDTMAECAGLELVERWGDWKKGAFTEVSKRHISVYRRNGL